MYQSCPGRARIDAPGALHHVILPWDRAPQDFLEASDATIFSKRLETILSETQTFCYAWALLPNHFHCC